MLKVFNCIRSSKNLFVNKIIHCNYSSKMHKNVDNKLETFRNVCDEIAKESGYKNKSRILQEFLKKGSDKKGFKGDTLLWIQMLLPSTTQRVYNLQNKQMLKLFSRLFLCDQQDMQLDLEQDGDVSETLRKFFETSNKLKPQKESTLYLQDVDEFLQKLEQKTKEDEQTEALRKLCKECTAEDLNTIIRLIKQDLRINAGARHILDAFGPFAYPAYQSSRDLSAVVKQFTKNDVQEKSNESPIKKTAAKKVAAKVGQVQVMTPISPMLANACKSVEEAFKKSPTGLFSEIKYDGERVQIHKQGSEFKFFSRNLKPVMDHKVKRFKEFIPKAFPGGGDMILDSEIILVDTVTGELLPFGTLGAHKKKEFANTEVCLFVFDCILYNGEDLTSLTFKERRKILEDNITPIKSYVQLSESHFLKTKNELSLMTARVLKANLEGVVLKSPTGTYQPGKRGWLKVKKDYLFEGKMADTADLVVLGGSFGSGKKGGLLSIFLMGCYDRRDRLWKTVTKVHTGLDDATSEEIHEKLMKIMVRSDPKKLPNWLLCKKSLVPDYIAKNPKDMPVWEITGAEFTKSEAHTAGGISIRFPRITKLRDDKSAEQANDLAYLQKMYDASKNNINVDLLIKGCEDMDDADEKGVEIESKINLNVTPKKVQVKNEKQSESAKKMKRKAPSDKEDEPKFRKIKSDSENDDAGSSKNTDSKKANPKVEHQSKLNFTINKAENVKKESEIFKNVIAYFDENIKWKDEHLFSNNGGTITKEPKNASIALYESATEADVKLDDIRKKFQKSCRHLSIEWVRDSVAKRKCAEFPIYAVVLY